MAVIAAAQRQASSRESISQTRPIPQKRILGSRMYCTCCIRAQNAASALYGVSVLRGPGGDDDQAQYGAKIRAHALDSPEELLNLLQDAGFEIEAYTLFSERRAGGTSPETAEAIGVVARRI